MKYYSKEKGGDDSTWKGSGLQMKDTIAAKDTQWGWQHELMGSANGISANWHTLMEMHCLEWKILHWLQLSQTGTCYCSGNDLIVQKAMQGWLCSTYIYVCTVFGIVKCLSCMVLWHFVRFHSNNCLLVYFDAFICFGSVVSFSRPCTLRVYIYTPRSSPSAYPQNIFQRTFSEMI